MTPFKFQNFKGFIRYSWILFLEGKEENVKERSSHARLERKKRSSDSKIHVGDKKYRSK